MKETVLIACAGREVDPLCVEVINKLARDRACESWRFVPAEWLDDEELRSAWVMWVTDSRAGRPAVTAAIEQGTPLLVPEQSAELKDFCVATGAGLYYGDLAEAEACLRYLVNRSKSRE
jgi:hypothetical protein